MDKSYAEYLLDKTEEDYNRIADHFSSTRKFIGKDLMPLLNYSSSGDKILDLGCGNGRLFGALQGKKINYTGVDFSGELIKRAIENFPNGNFQVTDILNLPFPENYFNKIYCIAVLHHIPSRELRKKVLEEIKRVLKPKGLLILTVWNFWQKKNIWKIFFKYTLLKAVGKSKLDFKDIFYPWRNQKREILAQRYFHLFTKRELRSIIKKADLKLKKIGILVKPGRKDNNIYLIAEK